MIKTIEKKMLEQNAQAVKYLKVFGLKDAKGNIKAINQQINRDFGLAGPMTLSSPSERVHAVRWVKSREIFVVETHVKRVTKETIAAGVSETNKCPYCVEVHQTSISSTGNNTIANAIARGTWKSLEDNKTRALIDWSLNTLNPNADIISNPPFTLPEATEIIGTALEFHSTNRLVSIFLDESPLPAFLSNSFIKKIALSIASKTLFKSMVSKKPQAGDSLPFIKNTPLTKEEQWAKNIPAYAMGLAAENKLLKDIQAEHIPQKSANLFKAKISEWQGEEMPLGKSWINKITANLDDREKPITTIMFLAAFTPYAITEKDIEDFRQIKASDAELLEVCYWAIQTTTNRIGEWLIKPFV